VTEILTVDDQIPADVIDPAKDDVGVRVSSVPMIDGDPLQVGAQVRLHAPHQLPGERL
jgi:hypothetical protein